MKSSNLGCCTYQQYENTIQLLSLILELLKLSKVAVTGHCSCKA